MKTRFYNEANWFEKLIMFFMAERVQLFEDNIVENGNIKIRSLYVHTITLNGVKYIIRKYVKEYTY